MKPYYSLSRAKPIGKQKTKKIKNLPINNEKAFYKEWVEEIDKSFQSLFQRSTLTNQPLSDDLKNYLLATSEFGQDIQSEIDLFLTKRHLNETGLRRKFNAQNTLFG